MTNFKDIRAAIKKAVDDANTSEKFLGSVYDYDASTLAGFPALIIVPTENQADYGSTAKDRDVFVFKLRLYFLIDGEADHPKAERALESACDKILTLFRERDVLGKSADWLEPAPSVWQYEIRGETIYRFAEITLKAVKYIG